jgi:hypothetical protein
MNGDARINRINSGRGGKPRFVFRTWSEFRDAAPVEVPYLIRPLTPIGAIGFVGAAKGAGKTWTALAKAIAVATGKPLFGRFPVPEARTVVYFALEGQEANLRDRIGALARGMGIDPDSDQLDRLVIVYKPKEIDLRDPEVTAELVAEALARQPGLVVFDVLRLAAHVRESGEGVGDFLEVLRNVAELRAAGCAVDFVHHFTKPNDATSKRDPGDRMSGSGSLFGHADCAIFITSGDRQARSMNLSFYVRDDAELGDLTVRLVGDGSGRFGGFTYRDTCRLASESEHDAAEQRSTQHSDAIGRYLEQQPGASQKAVLQAVGGNEAEVRRHLNQMIATEEIIIRRGARGAKLHYLPGDAPPAPDTLAQVGAGGASATSATSASPLRGGGGERTSASDPAQVNGGHPIDWDDLYEAGRRMILAADALRHPALTFEDVSVEAGEKPWIAFWQTTHYDAKAQLDIDWAAARAAHDRMLRIAEHLEQLAAES